MTSIAVSHEQWIRYRARVHGLSGGGADSTTLSALLRLGLQDTPQGAALLALRARTARLGRRDVSTALAPSGPLVLMWSVRGAPHAHERGMLDLVRAAHLPVDAADMAARLGGWAPHLDNGDDPREHLHAVAAAMRTVVHDPITKPELSQRVSALVPPHLRLWCGRCESEHVPDPLFRLAGLQAKLTIDPQAHAPTVLGPPPQHTSCDSAERARGELLHTFLTIMGPTRRPLFAGWMAASSGAASATWDRLSAELVRVQVEGKRYWMLERDVDALHEAEPADGVRLLPAHDLYLQAIDKPLLVPDKDLRARLWRPLSSPGAVVVHGEIAGIWRHRQSADTFTVTITPFGHLGRAERAAATHAAEDVATLRGAGPARVEWAQPRS